MIKRRDSQFARVFDLRGSEISAFALSRALSSEKFTCVQNWTEVGVRIG